MFRTYKNHKIKLPGATFSSCSDFLHLTPEQKEKVINVGMRAVSYAEIENMEEYITKIKKISQSNKFCPEEIKMEGYKDLYIELKKQNDILHKRILYYQHRLLQELDKKIASDEEYNIELEKYLKQ
jgi:hypothetical protein